MKLWITCPNCNGVLKAKAGLSEGPCFFCKTNLRVSIEVSPVSKSIPVGRQNSWKDWSDEAYSGRGPVPKLRG